MISRYGSSSLDSMITSLAEISHLPSPILHKVVFCSLLKAGLSFYGAQTHAEEELNKVLREIPSPYRGLINGKLYRPALDFMKNVNRILANQGGAILLKEANLHYVLDFLKSRLGKVGSIMVLDCASIPEFVTLASKLRSVSHHSLILGETFINPIGVTRFLTRQLTSFGQKDVLKGYAELLKQTLNANFCVKSSVIDLMVHKHGVTIDQFLQSIDIEQLFNQIKFFTSQTSILITSDHGYDVVADMQGLYVTHGYKGRCPLNFSKMALFLVVD